MLTFFNFLWLSFFICAISSFFIFFAQKFSTFLSGIFLFLTGISLQFIATDIFSHETNGKFIAIAILFIFTFEIVLFSNIHTFSKIVKIFYILPFLAFITIGLSIDLLTMLLGLTLFGLAFLILAKTKGKSNLQDVFLKINVGLLSYTYGMAILFSREGTIAIIKLHSKLSLGKWDNWTTLGVGLLCMGIIIELYAIIPLLSKTKK